MPVINLDLISVGVVQEIVIIVVPLRLVCDPSSYEAWSFDSLRLVNDDLSTLIT